MNVSVSGKTLAAFSWRIAIESTIPIMHPACCPRCGERVTPFAAGCALCGADLDPQRWQRPLSLTQRISARLPGRWRGMRFLRHATRSRVR